MCRTQAYILFRESDPTAWIAHSQENLRRANDEREQSARLRGLIGTTLSRTSQDMREQADRVEDALARRVAETEEASRTLETELKEVHCSKGQEQRGIIDALRNR